tara:strand:- start:1245 stop:2234 length:990 start_codon:yes stop_codon:yes gene_type:complete
VNYYLKTKLTEVTAIAHPNFALIKYWGKADSRSNMPAMSSISLTIDSLTSTTKISINTNSNENLWILNGKEQNDLGRINPVLKYLNNISGNNFGCMIKSENNFPTAAGLASSASGIASLVIAYNRLFKLGMSFDQLLKASMIGSGSAPRSLLGGFVFLNIEGQPNSQTILKPGEWPLSIIICITDDKQKIISSREGMEISRKTSPHYQSWLDSNKTDIEIAKLAIEEKNLKRLGEVSEDNCFLMHKVMSTSSPQINYMTERTNHCIQEIKAARKDGTDLFFTVDAGPQVKIVCNQEDKESIKDRLINKPYVMKLVEANIGLGARVIDEG